MTGPVDSLDTAYKVCTIIGLTWAGAWAAMKFIFKNTTNVVDGYIDRRSAVSIDERLKAIQCEVKPNGGGSLKDLQLKQMDRFESQDMVLAEILDRLKSVESRVGSIENKQEEAKTDLLNRSGS